MLEVKNLSAGYQNKKVVREINFSLKQGEKLAIIGANGSGKTTLLRALAGVIPCEGEILVQGEALELLRRKDVARKVALMQQMDTNHFAYTVYETVMLGRYIHNEGGFLTSTTKLDEEIVVAALKRMGLYEMKDQLITRLSGGQLQRVFLTRIFVQDPNVILLDEPMNHLDFHYQIELIEYLKEWSDAKNRCVVGVFHDLNLAFEFADVVLLMEKGIIQSYCKSDEFPIDSLEEAYGYDIKAYMKNALKRWSDE